jgi:hypothetical protein
MSMPNISVAPIHFEDFSGESFERLVFAYHLRVEWWHSIEWYGQVGSDSGRDIWAARTNDFDQLETLCIQCVNRERLTKAKAFDDITKVLSAPKGAPSRIRFVCSSDASAKLPGSRVPIIAVAAIYGCGQGRSRKACLFARVATKCQRRFRGCLNRSSRHWGSFLVLPVVLNASFRRCIPNRFPTLIF